MTDCSVIFNDNGLIIDGIFQDMPYLKRIYANKGVNLSKITLKDTVTYRGFHDILLKDSNITKIRFEGIKIPTTSQLLFHWFFCIIRDNPNTSPKKFIHFFQDRLDNLSPLNKYRPEYDTEKLNELERLRLRYLITIFKLGEKFENEREENFALFIDAIEFLSLFLMSELCFIEPGFLSLEENHPNFFCKKCSQMMEKPGRSPFCKYCRHEIRMEKQKEKRGEKGVKRLEYCAGGCGKKLIGNQRVWCGDPKCWLKIYRKK